MCVATSSHNQSEHAVCKVQLSACTAPDTQTHIHVIRHVTLAVVTAL